MKPWLLVLACALPASASPALEGAYPALSADALRFAAAAKANNRKVFPLSLQPVPPAPGPVLLDEPLARLRDRALDAVTADISGRAWGVSLVTDADYDEFFVVLRSRGDTVVSPLAPLGRFLEPEGVVVSDEDGPLLRLNARISLLHPINGTTIVAVDAEDGSKDSFRIGELIDALKARGSVIRANDKDYHVFVMPEAAGNRLSHERSVYIVRIAGTRTRGYAVRESALHPGTPYRVTVGEQPLTLLKTADDRLVVRDGR